MPIVSRTLVLLANRDDIEPGHKRWRVNGVDSAGRRWKHGSFGGTLVEAEIIRDTCWPQEQVDDVDEADGFSHILKGGDPETYARSDLTKAQWRKRIARRFWKATIEEDREFLLKISPYIASFTATQIASVLGISTVKAQKGIDKAISFRDVVGPGMADVDDQAEDV